MDFVVMLPALWLALKHVAITIGAIALGFFVGSKAEQDGLEGIPAMLLSLVVFIPVVVYMLSVGFYALGLGLLALDK